MTLLYEEFSSGEREKQTTAIFALASARGSFPFCSLFTSQISIFSPFGPFFGVIFFFFGKEWKGNL